MIDKRSEKSNRAQIALVIVVCVVGVLIMAVVVAAIAIRVSGKNKLKNQIVTDIPDLLTDENEKLTKEERKIWKEGWVKHDGRIYEYNDSIVTFLFMVIDKGDGTVKKGADGANGGRADALCLLVMDANHKAVRVIEINRNTMVPVAVYNDKGDHVDTVTAQIYTQYGFGNGKEESCEYQLKAVEDLFFNIPIHGYFAIDKETVIRLADLADDEDLTVSDLQKVIAKIRTQTRHDITAPLRIYNEISDRMVTNITAGELMYLVSDAGDYNFDNGEIYSVKGKYTASEDADDPGSGEFYADEDALKEMILKIFYDEVKISRKG